VKYERRLRTLASRVGLCRAHLTPLFCVTCKVRRSELFWTGKEDELHELLDLDDRCRPYRDQIPTSGVCSVAGCQGDLYCEMCYSAAAARVVIPGDVHTPEELARYVELVGHIQHRDIPLPSGDVIKSSDCAWGRGGWEG
jgi:hypothetical protein